jgi:Cupin
VAISRFERRTTDQTRHFPPDSYFPGTDVDARHAVAVIMKPMLRVVSGGTKPAATLQRSHALLQKSSTFPSSAFRSAICVLLRLAASTTPAQYTKVTTPLTKHLAGIPGKEGSMVTVEYAPGASSAIHRHNANTFVYVLEGSVVCRSGAAKK